ncbi:DMT family transporter [Aquirhabdus parva]|uniref:DMT family transporter n=1 Tax=Aquirhabdus parva TaxID=2283318 RepID=A0A345P8J2_9GAMM|nr:DMT family transporter [Aquirhabdus parva]AXI03601.1 DMT family transporter [Aquirhabdus parva]
MTSSLRYAYLGIILTTFFWGTNFNAGAYIIRFMSPITAATERFVIATLLLVVIFGGLGRLRLTALKQNLLPFIAIGLLGVVGFNMAMFFGLQSTTPINGALIMATTPLTTLALAYVFEREQMTLHKVIGLIFGLAGVILVITHGDLMHLLTLKIAHGDVMILAGSVSFSLTTIISRRFVVEATPLETTTFSMLFGTLILVILSLIFEHPLTMITAMPVSVHIALLYLAFFGSMIAYLFWFNGIRHIGSSRAAAFFNLVPVFTMLVSIIFGALPNIWQILGTLGVIIGVIFTTGAIQKRKATSLSPPKTANT